MKTNYLKNVLLVSSWMILATSFAIYASPIQWTSIQANLVNLVQYLGELYITSDGTPNGDSAMSVSHTQDGRWQVQVDGYFTSTFRSGDISSTIGIETSEDGPRWHMMTLYSGNMINTIGFDKAQDQILTTIQGVDMVNWLGSSVSAGSLGTISKYVVFDNYSNELRVDDAGITFWFEDNIQNNVESYTFPLADGSSGQVMTTDGAGQLSWADAAASSSTTRQIALIDTYDYVDLNNGSAWTEVTFNWQLPAGSMPAYFIAKVIQPFVSDSNKFVGTLALEYNGLSQAFWSPFAAQIIATGNTILDQVSTKATAVQDFNTHHNLSNPLDVVIWFTSFDGGTNPQDRTQWQVEIYIVYDSITLP